MDGVWLVPLQRSSSPRRGLKHPLSSCVRTTHPARTVPPRRAVTVRLSSDPPDFISEHLISLFDASRLTPFSVVPVQPLQHLLSRRDFLHGNNPGLGCPRFIRGAGETSAAFMARPCLARSFLKLFAGLSTCRACVHRAVCRHLTPSGCVNSSHGARGVVVVVGGTYKNRTRATWFE